jgi:hypothetical protein
MFVNFDQDILQLLRETKAIQRLDLSVPSAAIAVALQEPKLKVCTSLDLRSLRLKEDDCR